MTEERKVKIMAHNGSNRNMNTIFSLSLFLVVFHQRFSFFLCERRNTLLVQFFFFGEWPAFTRSLLFAGFSFVDFKCHCCLPSKQEVGVDLTIAFDTLPYHYCIEFQIFNCAFCIVFSFTLGQHTDTYKRKPWHFFRF